MKLTNNFTPIKLENSLIRTLKQFTFVLLLTICYLGASYQTAYSCNEQPISSPRFSESIDPTQTGITNTGIAVCAGCSITNPENVIGDSTEFATVNLLLPIAIGGESTATIYVSTNETFLGGKAAGFAVEDPLILGLIDLNLLQGISITTYDENDIALETFDVNNMSLNATLQADGKTRLTVMPTQDFQDMSIQVSTGLLSAAVNFRVYYAFAQVADSDGDGLPDTIEDTNGNCMLDDGETDSNDTDTDNDGLDDNEEDANGNGVVDGNETDPRTADSDNDGLDDGAEMTAGTDPNDSDTDNDGIEDGTEDANNNGIVDDGETDPNNGDSDNDGLNDGQEDANQNGVVDNGETDPTNEDSDNDGLDDGQEDANQNGVVDNGETDPTNEDSDNDGLNDGQEDANQNGIVDNGETDPTNEDSDNDGLDDGQEDANQNGVVDNGETDPTNEDSDNDGLDDGQEDANQNGVVDDGETDPRVGDTDNDGINDGTEIANGSSPTDPCSPDPNSAACQGTLPVNLVNFNATTIGKTIVLNWVTSAEINFEGFELQRTTNLQLTDFQSITTINAQKKQQGLNSYTYQDANILPNQTYFYRLLQKDESGNIEFSTIISVTLNNQASNEVNIYPNPATNWLQVESTILANQRGEIVLLNIAGQIINTIAFDNLAQPSLHLEIDDLEKGMYFLNIKTSTQQVLQKVYIQ